MEGLFISKQSKTYFTIGTIIILISTPFANALAKLLYQNLAGEYISILNGLMHSIMLVGILIFSIGLVTFIKDKK